ncbi:MAG: hypothetical protein LUD68_09185 [Rikenellaceae bacterium]|nr:hypothetical protein [Rikenellaceae bacterium]
MDPLELTYQQVNLTVVGNLETPFRQAGETRSITVSMERGKYLNGHSTGQWFPVPASQMGIYLEPGPFTISEARTVTEYELAFDISVPETYFADSRVYQLVIYIDDPEGWSLPCYYLLSQYEGSLEYRVVSESNPFEIPVEGGTFFVDFTVECRRLADGSPDEWLLTDLYGLKYTAYCLGAGSHHDLKVIWLGVGTYRFQLTARPYYLDSGMTMNWGCEIYQKGVDIFFRQEFLHPQDPELAVSGREPPATGNERREDYLVPRYWEDRP